MLKFRSSEKEKDRQGEICWLEKFDEPLECEVKEPWQVGVFGAAKLSQPDWHVVNDIVDTQ